MTVLAQPASFPRGGDIYHAWDAPRPSDPFHSRADATSFSLPPIRSILPEIDLRGTEESATKSHTNGNSISFMSPDYVASPTSKRRRLVDEAEDEAWRTRHVPRIYRGPRHRVSHSPRLSPSSRSSERWAPTPATTASPATAYGAPTPMEVQESSAMSRVTLPSLKTTMKFDEGPSILESSMSKPHEAPRAYSHDFTHYHTQSHYQSQPSSPARAYDRTPFSAGVYSTQHYPETGHFSDLGAVAAGGDVKQRKRRGNLPKETTDKLRAWFVAHLQHPYPTEDEKQDLMRQTGLQMNQISNWFINARRRQLPAMMNARTEADGHNGGRGISSREGKSLASPSNSDVEGNSSDENLEILRRRRLGSLKRGSV